MKYFLSVFLSILLGISFKSSANNQFDFADVVEQARLLNEQPYREETVTLPADLNDMDYDTFRTLRYVREKGPWFGKNIPFEIQFFHPGSLFKQQVQINEIFDKKATEIAYDPEAFTLKDQALPSWPDVGYAGFRLHYPLNRSDYYDELITFLGASYFRALGRGQKYGLSARGIAVDTGLETGEEFPRFVRFWIPRPVQRQRQIMVYALLDSPGLTGAYQFLIRPGKTTTMEITTVLFPRRNIQKLGVAPLTSMYLFGENTKHRFFDYRPEVHDSDGLLVHNGADEWIWRPLDNARTLRISSFEDTSLKGFGLLQRDRNPDHYQDFEADYHLRPGAWVEPLEGFGAGVVELVEIPSDKEIHDNVVAFFVPKTPVASGQAYRFKYRLSWLSDEESIGNVKARVLATYTGIGGVSGDPKEERVKFVIDFEKPTADIQKIIPVVEASAGRLKEVVMIPNPLTDGVRVFFDFKPEKGKAIELSARLEQDGKTVSEKWSYQWTGN